jgi:hypothetical protein
VQDRRHTERALPGCQDLLPSHPTRRGRIAACSINSIWT